MATRRVGRIKRAGSKKRQSHHGRKTNHRRRHHTRRQRGGAIQAIVRKTHGSGLLDTEINASGIDITKDTDNSDRPYKIGTQNYTTVPQLKSFKGAPRYARAVAVLNQLGITSLSLTTQEFKDFARNYCKDSIDEQCRDIQVAAGLLSVEVPPEPVSYIDCVVFNQNPSVATFKNATNNVVQLNYSSTDTSFTFKNVILNRVQCVLVLRKDASLTSQRMRFELSLPKVDESVKQCLHKSLVEKMNLSSVVFSDVKIQTGWFVGDKLMGVVNPSLLLTSAERIVYNFETAIRLFDSTFGMCAEASLPQPHDHSPIAVECQEKISQAINLVNDSDITPSDKTNFLRQIKVYQDELGTVRGNEMLRGLNQSEHFKTILRNVNQLVEIINAAAAAASPASPTAAQLATQMNALQIPETAAPSLTHEQQMAALQGLMDADS